MVYLHLENTIAIMTKQVLKYLSFFLLFVVLAMVKPAAAQDTIAFVDDSIINIDCDTFPSGVIKDYVDLGGNTGDGFYSDIRLYFDAGDTLFLRGIITMSAPNDYMYVYQDGIWVYYASGDTLDCMLLASPAIIEYYSNSTPVGDTLTLHFDLHRSSCSLGVGIIYAYYVTATTALLDWTSTSYYGPFHLQYNDIDTVVNYASCNLTDLARNTTYNCSVSSVADMNSVECARVCTFVTESCIAQIESFSITNITDSSITVSWEGPTGFDYIVSDGTTTDTTALHTYTFTGYQPISTHTLTVTPVVDTCCNECSVSLTATTNCYKAKVRGIRPLIGNDTITLTADHADGYLWSTGATTQSIEVWQPGYYTLVVFTNGGCTDTLMIGVSNVELDIDVDVPTYLCPGESTNVHVGLSSEANVHVNTLDQATLSDPTRIFLPDGVDCDPTSDHGCSYRSELEFNGFGNYQLMTDANDIRYVMLNIEHSYIGDIYINITCPNGQNADILRFSGNGTSSCTQHIGAAHRGWADGNNCGSCYLGDAYDYEDNGYPCDSTKLENRAGTGWRYCWSNNTEEGFTYAGGDALIYRSANRDPVLYNSFDSSNVAAGTNFYHPDQPLDALVGCPMNGTWYIEVIDGWGIDNGYIFGWELALNPNNLSRMLYQPTVASADLLGEFVTRNSDTTFTITCPTNLTADTTITYTVHFYDTAGNQFDTSFAVTFHPRFTRTFLDTITENQLPYTIYDTTFTDAITNVVLRRPNEGSCDSIITYSLFVIPSGYSFHDTTVCDDQLPLVWHGQTFTGAGTQSFMLTTPYGGDSTVTLTLHVNPTYHLTFPQTICSNQTYTFEGAQYAATGTYTHTLHTAAGCDSVRTLNLTVNPASIVDTVADECDQFTFRGTLYTASDTVTLTSAVPNSYGCDSALTLYLTIRNSTDSNIIAEVCDSFYWFGQYLTSSITAPLSHTLTNSVGCDSTVQLVKLDIYPTVRYNDTDTICASEMLNGYTWRDTIINSMEGGLFSYTRQDYHGCDSIYSLDLSVISTAYGSVYDTIVENQSATWSYNGIPVPHDTVMLVTIQRASGCDSIVTYHLKVWPNVQHTFDSTICANQWDSFSWHGLQAANTLVYVGTNIHGADSTVTLHLHTLPTYDLSFYDTICSDQFVTFEGNVYSTPGSHPVTYSTATTPQCDSIRTLHLTVYNTSLVDTVATVCDTFWWYGSSYTVSTLDTLSGHYSNAMGCDSLVALTLTVNHSTSAVFNDTCAENYLPRQHIHIITYSDTTGAQMVIPNAVGCDSLITYNLYVWRNVFDTLDSTICASALTGFTWNGQSPTLTPMPGTTPGLLEPVITDTLHATIPTVHGADSIITMVLHVRPTYQHDYYDTICDNQVSYFVDSSYAIAGDYSRAVLSSDGCDSLVNLHLTVNPTYTAQFYDTVYLGETVYFEGNAYNEPGIYTVTYSNQLGCDSSLVLNLAGKNMIPRSVTDSLCQGDSLWFFDRYLREAGTYYDTIFTGDFYRGDTVVELNLVLVEPPVLSIDTTHFCEPEPYFILEGNADVPYFLWSSIPYDPTLDGHESDTIIQVSPTDSSWYYLYADCRPDPLCPATDSVLLPPLTKVTAIIEIVPQAITLDERTITAYNRSTGRYTRHLWYIWYDGVQAFTSTDPVLKLDVPSSVDSVQISLQVFSHTCADITTVDVPIRRSGILFPNVFTPTQNLNNIFTGVGKGVIDYEIWIYDRRGDIVYHGTDIHEGWDGTKDGKPCSQGVYVYYCRYSDQLIPNGVQTTKGTVTLLR